MHIDWVGAIMGLLIVVVGICIFVWRKALASTIASLQRSIYGNGGESIFRTATPGLIAFVATGFMAIGCICVVLSVIHR